MKRKDFIKLTSLGGGYLGFSGMEYYGSAAGEAGNENPTAAELQKFLVSQTRIPEKTVDRIITGSPETRIKKVGTCWMSTWDTCKKAVASGVNVLVTHEPTFYTHWDLDEKSGDFYGASEFTKNLYIEQIDKKKRWISDKGLVIIRNHDTLDALKDNGIPFAFGRFLGFSNSDIISSRTYYNVYKTKSQTARAFSQDLARKLSELGQPGVAFYGDPGRTVSSVGIGTGCICDPLEFADLKPDVFIAIDDVVRTWTQTAFSSDTGQPLIVINHGTTEEMGMRSLNLIIRQRFPGIETIHFNQGCTYKWITA